MRGACEGVFDVALGTMPAHKYVVRRVVMEDDIAAQRVVQLDRDRQLLEVELDELRGVDGSRCRLGDNDGERFARVAHAFACEHWVGNLGDVGLGAVDRKRADFVGDLRRGEHKPNAWDSTRRLRVDCTDLSVRDRAARERGVQHPRQLQVVDVLGGAC